MKGTGGHSLDGDSRCVTSGWDSRESRSGLRLLRTAWLDVDPAGHVWLQQMQIGTSTPEDSIERKPEHRRDEKFSVRAGRFSRSHAFDAPVFRLLD